MKLCYEDEKSSFTCSRVSHANHLHFNSIRTSKSSGQLLLLLLLFKFSLLSLLSSLCMDKRRFHFSIGFSSLTLSSPRSPGPSTILPFRGLKSSFFFTSFSQKLLSSASGSAVSRAFAVSSSLPSEGADGGCPTSEAVRSASASRSSSSTWKKPSLPLGILFSSSVSERRRKQ